MSSKYSSFIEALDQFFDETSKLGTKDNVLSNYLVKIWFKEYCSNSPKYPFTRPMKDEYIRKNIETLKLQPSFLLTLAALELQWVKETPKNWEYVHRINDFKEHLYTIINRKEIHVKNMIKEGILNIFFRLTNHNSGAMVPLMDLVDEQTANVIFLKGSSSYVDPSVISWALRKWKLAVEGVLFTLKCMDVKFPAPYYPGLGVLERTDELYKAILQLEEAFQQPKTKKAK